MAVHFVWIQTAKGMPSPEKWYGDQIQSSISEGKFRYGEVASMKEARPGQLVAFHTLKGNDEELPIEALELKFPCPKEEIA